jgi:hypothetical protein
VSSETRWRAQESGHLISSYTAARGMLLPAVGKMRVRCAPVRGKRHLAWIDKPTWTKV